MSTLTLIRNVQFVPPFHLKDQGVELLRMAMAWGLYPPTKSFDFEKPETPLLILTESKYRHDIAETTVHLFNTRTAGGEGKLVYEGNAKRTVPPEGAMNYFQYRVILPNGDIYILETYPRE